MSNLMKAVQIKQFGGREVMELNDINVPVPAANEVLIKVKAAAVNPVDWKIREGYLEGMLAFDMPLTLGWDVSCLLYTSPSPRDS